MADYADIRCELNTYRVGVITLDRPEKLNAVSGTTFGELEHALHRLGADGDCGAVVVTGAGRAFCAGMDFTAPLLDGAHAPVHNAYSQLRRAVGAVVAMREIPQPVIAAVNGHAVGAGFAIASAADIRVCSHDAQFGAPFVKIGMTAGDLGLSWLLPRLIGTGAASEVFFTAGTLGSGEAHRLGLAQHVVDDPLSTAMQIAATIAMMPPLAVRISKELLNASTGAGGFREHLEQELKAQVIGLLTPEHQEASRKFLRGSRRDA